MRARTCLALALVIAAHAARAEEPLPIQAAELVGRIAVDGRLDEAEWLLATPHRSFVRVAPVAGGPPRLRTEVRVLQAAGTLYVGVRCLDPEPARIVRPLGRRDAPARSDALLVIVDADGDGSTAALFGVSAGGVESDALVYDDDRVSYDWDAVWEGAAAVDGEGWSAELAIPLAALESLGPGGGAAFRAGVVRDVARTRERSATFMLPRGARGLASRLGRLEGLEGIGSTRALSFFPYVATRLVARPRFEDGRAGPRLVDTVADVGIELRARTGGLTLAGAVNPDFGQVEADRVVQNLTTFETFFPEKRPFFTEGSDVFQPVGSGQEAVPQQLFYSRRIGLSAPILAAAKVVGTTGERLRVGVVEALVAGTGQPRGASEEEPARGLRWSAAQPLRLAPGDAYPEAAPATQNRLAAVARFRALRGLTLGATATSALPLGERCTREAAARDDRPSSCAAPGGNALALDAEALSEDAGWYAYGQAAASRAEGGPPERRLRDGTILRRGETGAGAYVRAGKRGGAPLRFDLGWSWAAPRLELNASGFQRTQNEQEARAAVALVGPEGAGPLEDWEVSLSGSSRWTTDGAGLLRGAKAGATAAGTLAGSHLSLGCTAELSADRWDVREIAGRGVPLRMPGATSARCELETDAARALSGSLELHGERSHGGPGLDRPTSFGTLLGVAARPHPRVTTRVSLLLDRTVLPLRWVGSDAGGGLLFARQDAPTASILVTQLWVLARRLTLQLHGQVLASRERYDRFRASAPDRRGPISYGDLSPAAAPARSPDLSETLLVLDAVLRWEVRPGATLYLVYVRNQAGPPDDAPAARGPVTDAVLVKWSWWTGGSVSARRASGRSP